MLNLPTVAECYKTYDDVNLVKTGDIGQVLVVGPLLPEEARGGEARDGITPPMRNARERVFRKPLDVAPATVGIVESQILDILNVSWAGRFFQRLFAFDSHTSYIFPGMQGGAPQNYKFVDHEEVWEIDPATGLGRWVPVKLR